MLISENGETSNTWSTLNGMTVVWLLATRVQVTLVVPMFLGR